MINIDEICTQIYSEVNAILAKNKLDTDANKAFTKREIEAYFSSLYKKKLIRMIPAVRFEDSSTGLKMQLYSGSNTKIDSIEYIISLSGQAKSV